MSNMGIIKSIIQQYQSTPRVLKITTIYHNFEVTMPYSPL